MIFQHTWQQVLDGSKTQTRRIAQMNHEPWFYGELTFQNDGRPWTVQSLLETPAFFPDGGGLVIPKIWIVYLPGHRSYQVGREVAIQPGRGQKAIGRIQIDSIRLEHVQDISEADARAEGYPWQWPPDPFTSYDPNLTPDPRAWYRALWDSINTRKGTRWADNPWVWVLGFHVPEPEGVVT